MTGVGTAGGPRGRQRRGELAAFLRSRRERITPADVGMPPGPRRRTPGLRREEVAQLAGVGVTWYTWLEQGRPINASTQVLDAVARTLRLDAAEREHLYRLAEVPDAAAPEDADVLPEDVQTVLDALDPVPAAVYNGRSDLLAWNRAYAAIFPRVVAAPPGERNSMWMVFTLPPCCNPVVNMATEGPAHVAVFRHRYSRHVDEPGWKELVRRLRAASPEFARLWADHDVAVPVARTKVFQHHAVGLVRTRTTSLDLSAAPGSRMIVYAPTDAGSRERIGWLLAHPEAAAPDHVH
ncbi:helix-turn-helix domain-containing protein [Actinomadura graeca]|uniref:Helix-turn-helix domain-containing protein n=1 Tax=Actinomadura graeca TaxID=2750812 RepID=A0ABX8R7I0_9ACTN|nr:helix-turn-helix transcriptional regulator [Actinomadura graeca]QXJ26229.1 helix-turn-helix domain-containing protein [Actinomadura graeca]